MDSEFSVFDHQCMARALRLAARGLYTCDPNPRVGCVIARGDHILAEGWHQRAGQPHAEIMALRAAGFTRERTHPERLNNTTAYVTLEPCSHQGRTPPCADALIEAGVERVIFASVDPNPQVRGSGRLKLERAGVRVLQGLMAEQARSLNPGFFSRQERGRPWVRIKTALSLDGRVALDSGESQWITGPESRQDVQQWRARSSAILTGIGTVLADDPRMTARVAEDVLQPARVILDSHWRTPPQARILGMPGDVLILGLDSQPVPQALQQTGVECVGLPDQNGRPGLEAALSVLASREYNEIQVEAGPALNGALLEQGLVDEILAYQAPVLMGAGGKPPFALGPLESMADRTHLQLAEAVRTGRDFRFLFTLQEGKT